MPEYGSKEYWDTRYSRVETPFDWMVDYKRLSSTLEPLLPDKNTRILLVGCGDAPFSADLYYIGGYHNQINADYSEVVIKKQREQWPEIDWVVMDCLHMKDVADESFDVVIDKSLIDTTMCYKDGYNATMKLYSELHRVLKPRGRLITISLHSEAECVQFGATNPKCDFVISSCSLASERQAGVYHTLCVFDKAGGLDSAGKARLASDHPIEFVNAIDRKSSPPNEHLLSSCSDTDEDSIDYHFGFGSADDLLFAFQEAMDDVFAEG